MTLTVDNRTMPDTARLSAASTLQKLVPQLVAVTMEAKQAHWNIVGFAFVPLHELTDELAASARDWTDRVAERAVALGFAVDARPGTVAAASTAAGGGFPTGFVPDHVVVSELVSTLDRVAGVARDALGDLERSDAVAHDITVEVLEGLEKYRWMLKAHTS
jgi:starvation-inducible DNA-binding protein